jgi:deferrochelatase/peroxidase EfeB
LKGPGEAPRSSERGRISRRGFLGVAGGTAAGAAAGATGLELFSGGPATGAAGTGSEIEPFYAVHQGGVVTSPQRNTYFAAVDLDTDKVRDIVELLKAWTAEAAWLTKGTTAPSRTSSTLPDNGEALGLAPSRLTLCFGLGPTLFAVEGRDKFGLAAKRPAALVDLPDFAGDELAPGSVGGDLTIQACADDPQVAFHAVRRLLAVSNGVTSLRWTQSGFNEAAAISGTPRNLIGFKDGTVNPAGRQLDQFVWVGEEGPGWMRGGTYAVFRRIRIALDDWDAQTLANQEQVIGRYKVSGAPLGEHHESDPLDLDAAGADGEPLIPVDAHVRVASAAMNQGQMILRRSFAYNDGTVAPLATAPSGQRAATYDAGLFFCSYQRDPRKGFIPIFENLSVLDALGQFTVHTASAIAAIPPGARGDGSWIGEDLFG